MTTSTHSHYNKRLAHSPYTIPAKHQQHQHHQQQHNQQHQPQHHHPHNYPQSPPSVQSPDQQQQPYLSREFVVRRISEGETGRLKEGLRCEACGKGYKHISSLAKHLWEHTPEWNVTKKLLISKHQQVQLLEAASILVGMNENPSNSSVKDEDSRYSSPFSPSNSAETNVTSTTPTPPMKPIDSNGNFISYNDIKDVANATAINMNYNQNQDFHHRFRSNSISQYPPTREKSINNTNNSINGGYLDSPVIINNLSNDKSTNLEIKNEKFRANSISQDDDDDNSVDHSADGEELLKSPPTHSIPVNKVLPVSSIITSPPSINNENAIDSIED